MGNTTGALLFITAGIVVGYLVFTKRIFQSSNPQTPQSQTPGVPPISPPSQSQSPFGIPSGAPPAGTPLYQTPQPFRIP